MRGVRLGRRQIKFLAQSSWSRPMNTAPIRYAAAQDGLSLAYLTLGRGPGRPLVFVPSGVNRIEFETGEPRTRAWYDRFAERRQVVCYDARGVGLSGRPDDDEGYRFDRHVGDLGTIVGALGLEEFDLWGSWNGAQVALEFAAADARVRHLVLWNHLSGRQWGSTPMRAIAAIRGVGDLELWAKAMSFRALPADEAAAAAIWSRQLRSQLADPVEFTRYMEGIRQHRWLGLADCVSCPTLILSPLRSGNSEDLKRQYAAEIQELARRIPDARTITLAEAMIVAELNSPDAIAPVVEAFLDGRPAAEPPLHSTREAATGSVIEQSGLSRRELEVLRMLPSGASNRVIAERLVIAESTVANHVRNILAKTRTANRTEAGTWAVRHGLVDDQSRG
jgi:DNA-binding CsgD family transcriptional regulator/pimeloyl-ACP methyl ester carboxylesterase